MTGFLQRLNELREEFHKLPLQKSGFNHHGKYKYFELKDFLPQLLELNKKHCILTVISFPEKGVAELKAMDADSEEEKKEFVNCVTFKVNYIEIAGQAKKGEKAGEWFLQPENIQDTGKIVTYMRRYLYALYADLIENDIVDSDGMGETEEQFIKRCQETYKGMIFEFDGIAQGSQSGRIVKAEELRNALEKIKDPDERGYMRAYICDIFKGNGWDAVPKENGGGFIKP